MIVEFPHDEFPKLEELKPGEKFKYSGEATVEVNRNGVASVELGSVNIETETQTDKEFKKMTDQPNKELQDSEDKTDPDDSF